MGRSSRRARAMASSPQGYQSTGLWACWRRYGLVSWASRLVKRAAVVTRAPRRLEAIDLLDLISHVMDRCFEVPGSRFRFGINSLLLLMPGLGDAIAAAISLFILAVAIGHYRVPHIVATRMILNTL